MTTLLMAWILTHASLAIGGAGTSQPERVIHVDARASGADNGTNWRDAYSSLQAALAVAAPGDEIWVAEGTYRPTAGTDRSATFSLVDGVAVLGGFAGVETDRGERNPAVHPPILSGNVGAADDDTDDSIHVVTAGATAGPSTLLDGFIVERGDAREARRLGGGGLYVAGSPTVSRVTFRNNRAEAGGAVYVDLGSPTFVNCTFTGNAARKGGAFYSRGGTTAWINAAITANTADTGAVGQVESGNVALVNCTAAHNLGKRAGGALSIDGGAVTVHNSIVWGNLPAGPPLGGRSPRVAFSDIEGGFPGAGNVDIDPRFVDPARGDLRLAAGSPAIDAGANGLIPPSVTTAIDGGPRVVADSTRPGDVAPRVDLGAYEFNGRLPVAPEDSEGSGPLGLTGDIDGDGVLDVDDCRPLDPSVWAVPSPARELRFGGSAATTLGWGAPSAKGGTSVLYDVLRSTRQFSFTSATCIYANGVDANTSDTTPVSSAYYYLVRAKNVCGGNLGTDSALSPRTGASCTIGLGQPCAVDGACSSGFCTDQVCCEARCAGVCEKCNLAGQPGICNPEAAGADPADECTAQPVSTCGLSGQCSGSRSCAFHPAGTVCMAASCANSTQQSLPDSCDGAGTCVDGGLLSCSPYACDSGTGSCRTACASNTNCAPGFGCHLGTGQCRANDGASCAAGTQCLSGACCSNICRNTQTSVTNCGSCGLVCTNPNGATSCIGGNCAPICNSNSSSCDGNPVNGCETPLTTLSNCGACGVPCSRANATATCATGACAIQGCNSNFSNCDANDSNGCEISHAAVTGTCASAVDLGSFDGDTACGFLCPSNTSWDQFATRTGSNSAFFRARAFESSTICSATIEHQIRVIVPPGVDYDLYVYRPCGTLVGSSTLGAGQTETVTVSQADGAGDSSFDYWVEVRYFNGSSCSNWTLQLFGHNC